LVFAVVEAINGLELPANNLIHRALKIVIRRRLRNSTYLVLISSKTKHAWR